ncbi:N-acetyltransferase [Halobacteriales archaeon QH_6_68_27]|nr:MAG: N-acetyltransferase [Halobacteriales archaeon QH_6_68_27]
MTDGSSDAGAAGDPVVRRYEPGDETAVKRVFERAMTEAGTDPADVPGTADLGWIEPAYIEPGGEFLVVEVDGEVVATAGLVVDGDIGELFRVAVDPARQRAGHGSRLLAGLEAAARDRGVGRLVLTTARRQAAALEFYRARGYEEIGRDSHGEYRLHRLEKRLD